MGGASSRRMLIGIDVDLCMLKFVLIYARTCLFAYVFICLPSLCNVYDTS